MTKNTNITVVVPDGPFARMRAIQQLADVLDPDHGPYKLVDAMAALSDGTLLEAAADAVNAAFDCIPPEHRPTR